MEGAVATALIAALASVLVATVNTIATRGRDARLAALEHDRRERESAATEQAIRARYALPLARAARDLDRRITNILESGLFDAYVDDPDRFDAAITSTAFRLAEVLGWLERVRQDGVYVLEDDEATRSLHRALSADEYGRLLMLWFEEQRAIGEAMQPESERPGIIGYGRFSALLHDAPPPGLARWIAELRDPSAWRSSRLGAVQLAARDLEQATRPADRE